MDINDPEELCYTLGLAGAMEAFVETELYSEEADDLKDLLIAYQSDDGYWDASELSDQESVQSTAYAIMALLAQGDGDALTSALKGSTWLIDTQDEVLGGWDPSSLGSGDENLEVDGEATWSIYEAITFPYDIIQEVETLDLPKGIENSLVAKLNAALKAFENGDYGAAINILNAFINQVTAQSGKKILPEDAEQLIGSAEALIAYISAFL